MPPYMPLHSCRESCTTQKPPPHGSTKRKASKPATSTKMALNARDQQCSSACDSRIGARSRTPPPPRTISLVACVLLLGSRVGRASVPATDGSCETQSFPCHHGNVARWLSSHPRNPVRSFDLTEKLSRGLRGSGRVCVCVGGVLAV